MDRVRALSDIRRLINDHAEAGACLWDPFLSAKDILETLFFCHRHGVNLRGLTSGKEPPEEESSASSEDFVTRQQRILARRGATSKAFGWSFGEDTLRTAPHSTIVSYFSAYPTSANTGLVLGTSINGIGKEHHILQQVDNGQAVMDAFLEL